MRNTKEYIHLKLDFSYEMDLLHTQESYPLIQFAGCKSSNALYHCIRFALSNLPLEIMGSAGRADNLETTF